MPKLENLREKLRKLKEESSKECNKYHEIFDLYGHPSIAEQHTVCLRVDYEIEKVNKEIAVEEAIIKKSSEIREKFYEEVCENCKEHLDEFINK